MAKETLRVLPRGTAMVPNYENVGNVGHGRAVVHPRGWRHEPSMGEEFTDPHTKEKKNHGGFRKLSEVVELPMRGEYIRHLRDGDLWPADQETAQAAGVPFDPTFGEEHPELTAKAKPIVALKSSIPTSPAPSAEKV